jgi:hypothetical protein
MNDLFGLGPWNIGALALALLGIAVAIIGRFKPGLGPWARALLLTGIALAVTGLAVPGANVWLWWLSGFAVCVALHRWADAVWQRD